MSHSTLNRVLAGVLLLFVCCSDNVQAAGLQLPNLEDAPTANRFVLPTDYVWHGPPVAGKTTCDVISIVGDRSIIRNNTIRFTNQGTGGEEAMAGDYDSCDRCNRFG